MTDKTDIAALRVKHQTLMNFLAARLTECNRINYCWDEVTALSAFTSLLLDQFEEKLQQASETNSSNLNIKLALHERVVKAEKEVITLKGELLPVGEIVAWSGTDIEKGITREIDFRFLRFDVQPGQQLFTAVQAQKPVVLPQPFTLRAGHPFNEGKRTAMIPDDKGNWLSKFDVEHTIKMAGGIVSDK